MIVSNAGERPTYLQVCPHGFIAAHRHELDTRREIAEIAPYLSALRGELQFGTVFTPVPKQSGW